MKELIDPAGQQRALRELANCWMSGMLELYIDPPAALAQASSDRPRSSPIARYLAKPDPDQSAERERSRRCDAAAFHSAR
jgi:hypothetical protein